MENVFKIKLRIQVKCKLAFCRVFVELGKSLKKENICFKHETLKHFKHSKHLQ